MYHSIDRELLLFKKSHKNRYNLYFHIFCSFIFTAFLFSLFKKYSYPLLILYALFIGFTIPTILILLLFILIILGFMIYFIKKRKLTLLNIGFITIIFYFLPELTHLIFNESSMLTIHTINPISFIVNIFYILPFSLMSI
jgi:hypothetical protein